GIANPLATIMSSALLLRHSLVLENEALRLEAAVLAVIEAGFLTPDLGGDLSTQAMGDRVLEAIA
ncbi:MAG: isocitrate/isopropylmalate family dehydrogenase, partial [Myxococcota bacterium]